MKQRKNQRTFVRNIKRTRTENSWAEHDPRQTPGSGEEKIVKIKRRVKGMEGGSRPKVAREE
jgi:hypothetical protein